MHAPLFVGDVVSAHGYRLAGLDTCTPDQTELHSLLERAREERPLIMITAEYAQLLPKAELDRWLISIAPPMVVVRDVRGRNATDDLASQLRRELGVLQ